MQARAEGNLRVSRSVISQLLIAFGLVILNAIFIVGPYISLWGVVAGGAALALSFFAVGSVMILSTLLSLPVTIALPSFLFAHPFLVVAASIIAIAISIILGILLYWLSRELGRLTGRYIRWQIRLIRGE